VRTRRDKSGDTEDPKKTPTLGLKTALNPRRKSGTPRPGATKGTSNRALGLQGGFTGGSPGDRGGVSRTVE